MAIARFYSSISQPTTLASGVSNASASIQVAATIGFPTSYPFTVAVDYGASAEELMDVTGAAGTTLTVVRAVDGTSAQSHGMGAVVRHVSSARDFADSRAHEAATAAVHGVSGTLVGTADAQTLANKTLTSPSISGATLSGTMTGTPTFSGAALFTGVPEFRAGSVSTSVLATRVTGDANPRLGVAADGGLSWGSGAAAGDTTLTRLTGGALAMNASLQTARPTASDGAYIASVSGDAQPRFFTSAEGRHEWGSGSAGRDTTLFRDGPNQLKTDGNLVVAGNLSVFGALIPSGIGQVQFARKFADETVVNSIVPQTDNELFFSVAPSGTYLLEAVLITQNASTFAADIAASFIYPTGTVAHIVGVGPHNLDLATGSSSTAEWIARQNQTGTGSVLTPYGVSTVTTGLTIKGLFIIGSTSGTVALQWAQNTANAAGTTVKQGSWMRMERVG